MAEIKIEKKKKPVWPWVVALLIIGAIVIWIWSDDSGTENTETTGDEQVMTDTSETEGTAANETTAEFPQVREYVSFVEENEGSMGLPHEYSHKGISLMASALGSVANELSESPELDQKVSELKNQGDRLMKETESLKHANIIRDAFVSSAEAFQKLQEMNYPDMQQEVQSLMTTAENVKKDVPATDQSEPVNNYFSQSADVLEQMANNINKNS